jgi:hypothetical protein
MTYEVSVRSMKDKRLAPIYDRWRWSEMYQAAHRVRPLLNKRHIVVACAVPLDGLKPTFASYSNDRLNKHDKLYATADRLLKERGYFTRKDLELEAGVHKSTVSRHWPKLIKSLDLLIVKIPVPSKRYPNGRETEFAVECLSSAEHVASGFAR